MEDTQAVEITLSWARGTSSHALNASIRSDFLSRFRRNVYEGMTGSGHAGH